MSGGPTGSMLSDTGGEAPQSAARQDPSELYGGGGREVVPSAQEHGARLAESRTTENRRSAADPDPWSEGRWFSVCTTRGPARALSGGGLYCFHCRAPRRAAARRADYLPLSPSSGNLRASCADCGTRMYRRVSLHKLAAVAGDLQVALPQAQQRIVEGADPSLNSHLEREPDAQPGE